MELTKEFAKKLVDEEARDTLGWEVIDSKITGTNRHGTEELEVIFYNKDSGKYACVEYRVADEGGDMVFFYISEVLPKEVITTQYEKVQRISIR